MAALHFLNKPSRASSLVGIVHINHNTGKYSKDAQSFLLNVCDKLNVRCVLSKITDDIPKGKSKEEYWREFRHHTFANLPGEDDVVLAHNFDDCLEEYVMCSMVRGYFGTIPYRHGRCVRPFRLWKRSSIRDYARKNHVWWVEDPSNEDTNFKRNYIRHQVVPNIKKLNPGVYNIVERAIQAQDERDEKVA